jgi:putative ABC transport system ATP-binding protein
MKQTAIECLALRKQFTVGQQAVHALRGVNLEVATNELLMLVGPSGCGKTTLISIIAGVLDSTSGSCKVFGNDWRLLSQNQKAKYRSKQVGFVFQSYNLIPALTAQDNVMVPLLIDGVNRKEARARAAAALERVALGEKLKAVPSQLSGGQQQRVAIARALVHNPRLLVCDEPTSALDEANGRNVMTMLRELSLAPDRAIVVVTHDQRIYHFADRIAVMNDGAIVETHRNGREQGRPGSHSEEVLQ